MATSWLSERGKRIHHGDNFAGAGSSLGRIATSSVRQHELFYILAHESGGLRVNPIVGWLLKNSFTKNATRTMMLMGAMDKYKKAAFDESCELWQAGKGVDSIHAVESCADIVKRFEALSHIWDFCHV